MRRILCVVCTGTVLMALVGTSGAPLTPSTMFANDLVAVADEGLYASGPQWESRRDYLRSKIESSTSPEAAEWASRALVAFAGQKHSGIYTPEEASAATAAVRAGNALPRTDDFSSGVSEVIVPSYVEFSDNDAATFASKGVSEIAAARSWATCGWILDLRNNAGGSMPTMLAAVSPLLPNGTALTIVRRSGGTSDVTVVGNQVNDDLGKTTATARLPGIFATVKIEPEPRVAILVDQTTASAAEFVAVAFAGLPRSRSFGMPTAGWTSYNQGFELPGGWLVRLTTGAVRSRDGRTYRDQPLAPDVPSDNPLADARQWLAESCDG